MGIQDNKFYRDGYLDGLRYANTHTKEQVKHNLEQLRFDESDITRILANLRTTALEMKMLPKDKITTHIPQNNLGIVPRWYSFNSLAEMIYFLADMME